MFHVGINIDIVTTVAVSIVCRRHSLDVNATHSIALSIML